jgi:hypothetical protein
VDLTHLTYISPFDTKRKHLVHAVSFLRNFVENITKPISRDGAEHIEYIPSQVVTEYIRDVMPVTFKTTIDGIKYKSTKTDDISYVMFADIDAVTADNIAPDKDKLITMLIATVKTRPVKEL